MKYAPIIALSTILLSIAQLTNAADNILEDEGVGLSRGQLEFIVDKWPPQMQQAAANDVGDRLELLSKTLGTDKIARDFDQLTEADGEAYWQSVVMLRDAKRRFMIDRFLQELEIPDMTALAKERYAANKDQYALVKEQRISSHILIACNTAGCDPAEKKSEAEAVLQQLQGGASFEDMVAQHSIDQGTKVNGGKFDRWIGAREEGVAKGYVIALHKIGTEGEYSGVVETQFGNHIIRLDEIKAEHHQTFEEVQPTIVAALEKEYRKRSLIDYVNGFGISEDVYINGPEMEAVFSQYKDVAPTAVP